MASEGLLTPIQTNSEGSRFWRIHFGWSRVEYLFPTIFDYAREDLRNHDAGLFSLMSLLLMFFYGYIFNSPGTVIQCTAGSDSNPTTPSSNLFAWIYVTLWIAAMMGNTLRYSEWLYHVGTSWVIWSVGCLSYALKGCSLALNLEAGSVIVDTVFVMLLITHYLAGFYWVLYYLPRCVSDRLSPLYWFSFLTHKLKPAPLYRSPIHLKVGILLSLWCLVTLFLQVHLT